MRFLLDANMPRSVLRALSEHGHEGEHVNDLGLGAASDDEIAARACADGAALMTRDLDFADIRSYPPEATPGIVVIRVPDDWIASRIAALVGDFLRIRTLVTRTPGHLVIVDQRQARFRPALHGVHDCRKVNRLDDIQTDEIE